MITRRVHEHHASQTGESYQAVRSHSWRCGGSRAHHRIGVVVNEILDIACNDNPPNSNTFDSPRYGQLINYDVIYKEQILLSCYLIFARQSYPLYFHELQSSHYIRVLLKRVCALSWSFLLFGQEPKNPSFICVHHLLRQPRCLCIIGRFSMYTLFVPIHRIDSFNVSVCVGI